MLAAADATRHGTWKDVGDTGNGRLSGKPAELYATSVACFVLAIPNRYLPILQEGKIESLKGLFDKAPSGKPLSGKARASLGPRPAGERP